MIDISDKTFAKILADMLLNVNADLNKREGSLIRTSLAAAAWAIEGLYLDLQYIQKQSYGMTATTEYLDYIAAEAGIERKQPVAAIKYARFNIAPPISCQFSVKGVENSPYYVLIGNVAYSEDPSYPDAPYIGELECETPGEIGNVYSGDLSCVNFVSGLTTAFFVGTKTPGVDIETDASLRKRYLAAIGKVEFAGNITAYRNFMLSQDGVGAVQVYPVWNGAGTVLLSVVDDKFLPLSNSQIAVLQEIVCPPESGGNAPSANGYGMAPIGAVVTVTTPQSEYIYTTANISIKPTSSRTKEEIEEEAATLILAYIHEQCESWGEMASWTQASYSITIYINKIAGIINGIDGVEVATNVRLNGGPTDIILQQSAQQQKIPVFGGVSLTEV